MFSDKFKLIFDNATKYLKILRKNWATSNWDKKKIQVDSIKALRILIDEVVVEIFINGGEYSLTSKCFFNESNTKISIKSDELLKVKSWILEDN